MNDKIWDISPTIHLADSGIVKTANDVMCNMAGAYADVPRQYGNSLMTIDQAPLSPYIGACQIIDARSSHSLIFPEQIESQLSEGIERVIFKTYDWSPQDTSDDGFTAIHTSTVTLLNSRGVRLVGIDTPSIDSARSKSLNAHHAVKRFGMSILKGLVLDNIICGIYELIALPIKYNNLNSAPVRAILRQSKYMVNYINNIQNRKKGQLARVRT